MAINTGRVAGPVQQAITSKLENDFTPSWLEVINESHLHNVPSESEMHFKVIVVSENFAGQSSIARHRSVHRTLHEELSNGLHALTITSVTASEWAERSGFVPESPQCRGGEK